MAPLAFSNYSTEVFASKSLHQKPKTSLTLMLSLLDVQGRQRFLLPPSLVHSFIRFRAGSLPGTAGQVQSTEKGACHSLSLFFCKTSLP